ncbi:MAG: HD domain-containing protein [Clostridiales bacterium]|nr:HD domain-containing protein [Clostridiales bacterium]
MQLLCVLVIFLSAFIGLYSVIDFYRDLKFLQIKTSASSLFFNKLNAVAFAVMVAMFLGYIVVDITFLFRPYSQENLVIAGIFLFAAIFVFVMTRLTRKLSTSILEKTDDIMRTLVNVMEAKDPYMRGHSSHVYNIVRVFCNYLPRALIQQINQTHLMDAAILHDIGKIALNDNLVNNTGKLSDGEWALIKQHPALGKAILQNTSYGDIGEIIKLHHERMDGNGYYGVKGPQIPMESRVLAIADTFSALYNDRGYRGRMSFEDAMRIIRDEAGRQFDAELVNVFASITREDLDATAVGARDAAVAM